MLVHNRPGIYRNDGFRGWRAVAQSTVWSLCIVVFPPFFNDDLRLFQGVEDFSVQQFVPEAGIKAFTVSVLPWRPWLDVGRLCSDSVDPVSNCLSNELRSVV